MLDELRRLREEGFPEALLMNYAEYRIEYHRLPFEKRQLWDFGYFMRMKHIEYMQRMV